MGYSIILFLVPPYCLIPMSVLFGICFAAIYSGTKLFRLQKDEIAHPKGSLISLALSVWGISVVAMILSLVILAVSTQHVPFFQGIHSEWGIAFEQAYLQAGVYIVCWALLFALLQLPSIFVFKKKINEKTKRKKLFVWFLLVISVLWASLLWLVYLL